MHDDLIARLEAARGPDAHLGEAVLLACGWKKNPRGYFMGQLWGWASPDGKIYCDHDHFPKIDPTASIDAALALVPEDWTAWELRSHAAKTRFSCDLSQLSEWDIGEDWMHGRASTPALAICIAALKASRQGEG